MPGKPAGVISNTFSLEFSASYKKLITPIQILPAHLAHESVNPFPGNYKALWDTGATSSTISTELATKCKLPIIGQITMNGAGGSYLSYQYLAGLELPNNIRIAQMVLNGFAGSDKFDMLIGMDIIVLGDFLVSTINGITRFSFQIPSMGGITLTDIKQAVRRDGLVVTNTEQDQYMNAKRQPANVKKIGRNEQCPCGSGKKYKNCCGK